MIRHPYYLLVITDLYVKIRQDCHIGGFIVINVSDRFYHLLFCGRLNGREKEFFKVSGAKWSSEEVWNTSGRK